MKILCITSRVPWPLEKGDKLRCFHQLRQLSRRHEIVLFALNDAPLHPEAIPALSEFCSSVYVHNHSKFDLLKNLVKGYFSGLPFQVAYFTSEAAKKHLATIVSKENPEAIYCQLIRTAEYRQQASGKLSVLDYMDVFSKGVERRMSRVPWYKRWVFRMEWQRLLNYEASVYGKFDRHTVISRQDRDLIPVVDPTTIEVVPNGVDIDYFHPKASTNKFELLFNGNMNYPPNIESAQFLVKEILPLVLEKHPAVRLLISGANPAPEVEELAGTNVVVSGWVDDVRESYSASRILVAPMKISIGLQNKLLEAMAMRLPCITTPLANNALQAIPGEQLLLADSAQEFSTRICELLENPEMANRIADGGHQLVKNKFDWTSCTAKLEAMFR